MMTSDASHTLSLTVSKVIPASREKVFAAWLDADIRTQWWFPNMDGSPAYCELDPRVGGTYLIRQTGCGEEPIPGVPADFVWEITGEFVAIDRPNRIVFTWNVNHPNEDETDETVTVDFADADGGTLVTITHTGIRKDTMREGTEKGWTEILDRQTAHFGAA